MSSELSSDEELQIVSCSSEESLSRSASASSVNSLSRSNSQLSITRSSSWDGRRSISPSIEYTIDTVRAGIQKTPAAGNLEWQGKHFIFTAWINEHPTYEPEKVDYMVYQRERCPKTRKYHWQIYACFRSKVRAKQALESLELPYPGTFIARCNSPIKSMAYCKKQDTRVEGPFEKGDIEKVRFQGERTDYQEIKEILDEKGDLKEVAENYFSQYLRYSRGLKDYCLLKSPQRNWKPIVHIVWGPSGVGKSTCVRKSFPNAFWISRPTHSSRPVWFDGYVNQKALIFDDFYGWLPYDYLLRLLDSSPMDLDTRGASVHCVATHYIFTTNKDPHTGWYDVEDQTALHRRFKDFATIHKVHGETDFAALADLLNK